METILAANRVEKDREIELGPEQLKRRVNFMNVNQCPLADDDFVEGGAIVLQRYFIFAASFKVIPRNWVKLRFRHRYEIEHIGAIKNSFIWLLRQHARGQAQQGRQL